MQASPQLKALPLRPAAEVMTLARLGAAFPTRLSFMRTLLRRVQAEACQVSRPVWHMDDQGYGEGVYSLTLGGHTYSLVAISSPLADADRSDRVIAEAWDAAFVLYDGVPDAAEIARIAQDAPRQEAAQFTERDLVLSRANKSVRLFQEVASALAAGQQPALERIDEIGYLMRTTAVYGNGKFGIADRSRFQDRPGLRGPFQAEMLTVWLIRAFTHDLVEHVAACVAPDTAVKLDPKIKRHLGIGNSTGLGMAPFLVTHPQLLNAWVLAQETALARVLSSTAKPDVKRLSAYMAQVATHLDSWNVADPRQMARIKGLRHEVQQLDLEVQSWAQIHQQGLDKSLECQELLSAILIDLNPDLVDDLADTMTSAEMPIWLPAETVGHLKSSLEHTYAWALDYDFDDPEQTALFWYTSEEKLEPRLGRRYEEPGADLERPLDIARQVQGLHAALAMAEPEERLAFFFVRHPHLRSICLRVQSCRDLPYAEIQANLIAEGTLPIDMLRFKLAMFGAGKFDPKSDLWTRITLFQGAPLINEQINEKTDQDWGFATLAA